MLVFVQVVGLRTHSFKPESKLPVVPGDSADRVGRDHACDDGQHIESISGIVAAFLMFNSMVQHEAL